MNTTPNMFCVWHIVDPKLDKYRCVYCGKSITVLDRYTEPPMVLCTKTFLSQNSDYSTVDNLTLLAKEVSSSSPDRICSVQETNRRYEICQSCEFLKDNICNKCGCLIFRDKVFLDKLTSKDETCPLNKW